MTGLTRKDPAPNADENALVTKALAECRNDGTAKTLRLALWAARKADPKLMAVFAQLGICHQSKVFLRAQRHDEAQKKIAPIVAMVMREAERLIRQQAAE